MPIDSLDELKIAFEAWRSLKQRSSESPPETLVARARRGAGVYGVGAVAKATKMTYTRLRGEGSGRAVSKRPKPVAAVVPSYSRVELVPPPMVGQPLVEVEMISGVKLRAFILSPEALGLLSSLCRSGGVL